MDLRGYYIEGNIRKCRILHWDGFEYHFDWPWVEDPTYEQVKQKIDAWWDFKESSGVKRFK